jgi:hypothetical protein
MQKYCYSLVWLLYYCYYSLNWNWYIAVNAMVSFLIFFVATEDDVLTSSPCPLRLPSGVGEENNILGCAAE